MQEIAYKFGGEVSPSKEREYGRSLVTKCIDSADVSDLIFKGVESSQMWMSHGDKVAIMPKGFVKIATTENSEHAG